MQPTAPAETTGNSVQKFVISALNGTVTYALAYLLVNGLHQLVTVLTAARLHVRGAWGVSQITYSLSNGEWWRTAVLAVYGIGPLVVAIVGLLVYQWYWQRQRAQRGLIKLLLLWVALHACNAVLGALLADTLLQTGFWYVPAWLFQLGNGLNVPLALLASLGQVAVGYFASVAFLQAHDSHTVMRYPNRRRMVLSTIFVPWAAGSVSIALAKAPNFSLQEGLHFAVLGLLLVPMALGCLNETFDSPVRSPQQTRVAWGLLLLLGLALAGGRVLLNPPVVFGL